MKYRVFEMVTPEILEKKENRGYEIETTSPIVLKPLKGWSQLSDITGFNSEAEAMQAIEDNRRELLFKQLCIIPVIDITWDGEIY